MSGGSALGGVTGEEAVVVTVGEAVVAAALVVVAARSEVTARSETTAEETARGVGPDLRAEVEEGGRRDGCCRRDELTRPVR